MKNMTKYNYIEGQRWLWNCHAASAYAKFPLQNTTIIQKQSENLHLNLKSDVDRQEDVQTDVGTTTRSTNDAVAERVELAHTITLPNTLLSAPDDGLPASVKSFLGKPYAFRQGDLALTDTPATFGDFPTSAALRTNLAFKEKLSGVMSMRYTTVITLQVNANRFQQGRYIIGFIPTGGALYSFSDLTDINDYINMHKTTKVQITQSHHAELDVNTDTSVQLRIPYVGAFPALNYSPTLSDPYFGDPGIIFMYPYSPLSAPTGNVTAGYTIWVHYEDVEVFGNTVPIPIPQTPAALVTEAQSAFSRNKKMKRKNVDIFENEIKQDGPITSGLRLISEGMEQFSRVPFLSSVAAPLGWSIKAASNVASTFGWSKPPVLDKVVRMNRFPHPYIANSDQADDSQPLALFSDNHVHVAPGFSSTDLDEMSINYIKSIFSWYETATWGISANAGDMITEKELSPTEFFVADGFDAGVVHLSPVTWLSSFFERYTGGLIIKIKVVKTEFHSGRLLFAFNPSEGSCVSNDFAYNDTAYLHKTILDIREQNEFVIEIPYVSIIPWRSTTSYQEGRAYGRFKVFVLDELVAPETVSSEVQLLMEVCGAPDLQYAVPRTSRAVPYAGAQYQMDLNFSKDNANTVSNPTMVDVAMVGGTTPGENSSIKDEYCIGEVVTSLRSLVKRGGFMGFTTAGSATTQNCTVTPYAWTYTKSLTNADTEYTADIFTHMSSVYALVRGSVRIRQPVTSAAGLIQAFTVLKPSTTGPDNNKIFDIRNVSTINYIEASYNTQYAVGLQQLGGIAVQVPFYHYTHSAVTLGNAKGPTNPLGYDMNRGGTQVNVAFQYSPAINLRANPYYRAGADDLNFGTFVSTVPLINVTPPAPA